MTKLQFILAIALLLCLAPHALWVLYFSTIWQRHFIWDNGISILFREKRKSGFSMGDFGNIVSTYYKNIFRKDNMEYYRRFGSNNLVYNYFAF